MKEPALYPDWLDAPEPEVRPIFTKKATIPPTPEEIRKAEVRRFVAERAKQRGIERRKAIEVNKVFKADMKRVQEQRAERRRIYYDLPHSTPVVEDPADVAYRQKMAEIGVVPRKPCDF